MPQIPETMKAAVITEPGGPEVIQVQDIQRPTLQDGEALIEVEACAANYGDVWLRQGEAPASPPVIPGLDIAGYIREVKTTGDAVAPDFDRVVVYGVLDCGECANIVTGVIRPCV